MKKSLLLTFFVLDSLFILENVFARKAWNQEYVQVEWVAQYNSIYITIAVYDYSFGPMSEHGFLKSLKIEASVDASNYYRLMDIATPQQIKTQKTMLYLKNKLDNAKIKILDTGGTKTTIITWPEESKSYFKLLIGNYNSIAVITLGWSVERAYKNVAYIRILGIWHTPPNKNENINNIVYPVYKHF